MTTEFRRITRNSTFVEGIRVTVTHLRARFAALWTHGVIEAVTNIVAVVTRTSALGEGFWTVVCWTRHSLLYRWLMEDSDTDVQVVGIRDVSTVVPFLKRLDRFSRALGRTWRLSFAYRATRWL